MITILGAVFFLFIGAALVFRQDLLPWILSAAVPFSATAGLTVAGQSIVMYHVVAIVVIVVAIYRHRLSGIFAADLNAKQGSRPLLAFGAWALVVTALMPTAFAGTPVLDPRQGIDDGVKNPAVLAPSISNFAQSGYLVIGIATVFALATMRTVSPRLPAAGFGVGTVLSSGRSLLPDSLNAVMFENSENVCYTNGEFDGVERMRGIFSEPAALGAFSVAATVFFLLCASQMRGAMRLAFIVLGAWASVNAVLSYSGGALVSGLAVLAIVALHRTYTYCRSRLTLSPLGLVGFFLLAVACVLGAPAVYSFVQAVFTDKAGSSSYENRNAADTFSYSVSGDTLGLGVGVGSNRPSSFIASLASTVGVPGTALFACAVIVVALGALRRPGYSAVVAALVSVLISKIVAGPDLSDPIMWFLLAVSGRAAWSFEQDHEDRLPFVIDPVAGARTHSAWSEPTEAR